MTEMTSRERVLRTFCFERTDRTPFDLMESVIWPDLQAWYVQHLGLADKEAVSAHFDLDFRWFWVPFKPPATVDINNPRYTLPGTVSYSDHTVTRPLAGVRTIAEMHAKHEWMDPTWWEMAPIHGLREQHPDKAIVMILAWAHPFMVACEFFGIEETLVRLQMDDEVLSAFLERQSNFVEGSFRFACREARGAADICWLMDDVATQRSLMMRPETWRRHLKPLLRRQVEVLHEHGVRALFHSCGAIRAILPDLVEIGVDGVLPFQTSAEGMSVESIARDFGGKIVFYGGMDIQQLLTFGTEEEVRREVRRNIDAFAACGGYIVANSHHCIANLKPENITAMLDEARRYRPARAGQGSCPKPKHSR